MYLINTTFIVDEAIDEAFLGWARGVYLAALKEDSEAEEAFLCRVMAETEPGVRNYAVQFRRATVGNALRVLERALAAAPGSREQLLHFSTAMKIIG